MPSSLTKISQVTNYTKIKKGHLQAPATTPHDELTMETLIDCIIGNHVLVFTNLTPPTQRANNSLTPEYNGRPMLRMCNKYRKQRLSPLVVSIKHRLCSS